MELLTLTRKEAALLLLSMQGRMDCTPVSVLQEAWRRVHADELPLVLEKLLKSQHKLDGLSLTDIVSLGNRIEYTNFSITSVQNWVKRDFREFVGPPEHGKKYSFEQAALLFIIEDLKMNLDFDSIRSLFELIFSKPGDGKKSLLPPTELFYSYSALFEELDKNNDQLLDVSGHEGNLRNRDALMENMILERTEQLMEKYSSFTEREREVLRNVLMIALVSVQTAYFQSLARRYANAALLSFGRN